MNIKEKREEKIYEAKMGNLSTEHIMKELKFLHGTLYNQSLCFTIYEIDSQETQSLELVLLHSSITHKEEKRKCMGDMF